LSGWIDQYHEILSSSEQEPKDEGLKIQRAAEVVWTVQLRGQLKLSAETEHAVQAVRKSQLRKQLKRIKSM
jgi:hypothetical protein